jgi:hypothetical protein
MYIASNNGIISYNKNIGKQISTIPNLVYVMAYDERSDTVFLQPMTEFKVPDIIYGKTTLVSDRIINTFFSRSVSTGALLAGEKGSGKTLLLKVISNKLIDKNIPTIIINDDSIPITAIANFLSSCIDRVFVIFDEFEKNYNKEEQNKLLSLLDGNVSSHNKLYAIVVNEVEYLSKYFLNRPGRLFYYVRYYGLDDDFIEDYCNKELKDKKQIPNIIKTLKTYETINFDMLKAIVEEMNRYNEPIEEVIKILNIENTIITVKTYYSIIVKNSSNEIVFKGNIYYNPFNVVMGSFNLNFKNNENKNIRLEVDINDMMEHNRKTKTIKYLKNGYTIVCNETDFSTTAVVVRDSNKTNDFDDFLS